MPTVTKLLCESSRLLFMHELPESDLEMKTNFVSLIVIFYLPQPNN